VKNCNHIKVKEAMRRGEEEKRKKGEEGKNRLATNDERKE
jgi:hypothetical protein